MSAINHMLITAHGAAITTFPNSEACTGRNLLNPVYASRRSWVVFHIIFYVRIGISVSASSGQKKNRQQA